MHQYQDFSNYSPLNLNDSYDILKYKIEQMESHVDGMLNFNKIQYLQNEQVQIEQSPQKNVEVPMKDRQKSPDEDWYAQMDYLSSRQDQIIYKYSNKDSKKELSFSPQIKIPAKLDTQFKSYKNERSFTEFDQKPRNLLKERKIKPTTTNSSKRLINYPSKSREKVDQQTSTQKLLLEINKLKQENNNLRKTIRFSSNLKKQNIQDEFVKIEVQKKSSSNLHKQNIPIKQYQIKSSSKKDQQRDCNYLLGRGFSTSHCKKK